ncbi:SdrD B-like domain-containing protein [Botrimarina sp.]|uniref:DUF7619 domain-containing protein n=1 Tax=Botrimarina sp. TaxID=2795802 RepID=UPI0032EB6185
MSFRTRRRQVRRAPRRYDRRRNEGRLRPGETLEPRLALDAAAWVGGDGFWDDPANWSTGQVPGPGDDATLNVPGTVTVTVRDGRAIGTIAGAENLLIAAGSGRLTVGGASTYGGVIDIGGELALSGDLAGAGAVENRGALRGLADAAVTIGYAGAEGATLAVDAGRLTLSGGAHVGGVFQVDAGATLELAGVHDFRGDSVGVGAGRVEWTGTLRSIDPRDRGAIDFDEGLLFWVDGSASNLINNGFVQIDTAAGLNVTGALTNNGSFVHQSESTVTLNQHSEFVNHGVYEFRGDGELVLSPGTSAVYTTIFHNLGVIRKSGGDGVSRVYSNLANTFLNHTGEADARTGTLALDVRTLQVERQPFQGDYLRGGVYRVADGATLLLQDGFNIVNNHATVILEGPGAAFPAIDTLASNAGVFHLEGGRDFSAGGDLTNGVERIDVRMQNALVTGLNDQLGIAVDPDSGNVLLLSRDESIIREVDANGRTVRTIPRPTEPTSGTGISALTGLDVASAPVSIGGVIVPAGTLLMSYGDDAPPQVLALDRSTGQELAGVAFDDLPRGQPGVAHHPGRGTLFIMSSDNRLYEVDPSDGSLVNSFGLNGVGSPTVVSLNIVGGVEVNEATGNLYVAVDRESLIRELTPTGDWVADYDLEHLGPRARNTVNNFSGIAVDNATGDVWILNREKRLWRFSAPNRGVFGELDLAAGSTMTVNGEFTQVASATTRVELAGRPSDLASGRLDVVGDAALGGALEVTQSAGFTPVTGDQFTVVSFAARNGTEFDAIVTPEGVTSRHTDGAVVATVGDAPVGSPDLVVSGVTGPTSVVAGGEATISWTVTNAGPVAAAGPWRDAVSLTRTTIEQVSDPSADGELLTVVYEDRLLIEDVLVGDGAPLAPGESRTFSATVRVPARELGEYYWQVETNARFDLVEESADDTLNAALGEQAVVLDVPVLPIDGAAVDAVFSAEGQPLWFRLDGVQDRDIQVSADLLAATGVTELYLGAGYLPTRYDYTHRHQQLGAADVSAVAPLAEAGAAAGDVWYVAAYPKELPGVDTPVSLAAERAAPTLAEVASAAYSAAGRQTLDVRGANLSADVGYRLVDPTGGGARDSLSVVAEAADRAFVAFDLTGLAPGVYDLVALDNGAEADRLVGGVTLQAAPTTTAPPEIRYWLSVPEVMRADRPAEVTIHYTNQGSRDAALPWLTLQASAGTLSLKHGMNYGDSAITVLSQAPTPGLTVLPAGATGQVRLLFRSPAIPEKVKFSLHAATVDDPDFASREIDWSAIGSLQRPAGADAQAWQALVDRNRARYGDTYAELHEFAVAEVQDLVAAGYRNVQFYDGRVDFDVPAAPSEPFTVRGVGVGAPGSPAGFALFASALEEPGQPSGEESDTGGVEVAMATGGDGIAEVHTVVIGPNFNAGLPGAQRDADAFAKLITTGANYSGPEPILVNYDDSTPENILDSLRRAAGEVDADDTLFVYWASHGICSVDESNLDVIDADRGLTRPRDVYFSVGDTQDTTQRVTPADINTIFAGVPGQTAIVADTCHSGEVLSRVDADVRIASAGIRSVIDSPSFGSFLRQELQDAPTGANLVQAAERAADKFVENTVETYAANSKKPNIRSTVDALRDERFSWPTDPGTGQTVESLWLDFQDNYLYAEGLTEEQRTERARNWRNLSRAAVSLPLIDRGDNAEDPLPSLSFKAKGPGEEDTAVGQTEKTLRGLEPVYETESDVRASYDPNEKVGPAGVAGGFVRSGDELPFTVYFENDPDKATLPAQVVTITDTLDADLDLATFELGDILVGDVLIDVPEGRYAYESTESLRSAGIDLAVRVEAELDFATRTVTWVFESIDPLTGEPTLDPLAGFLLVNDATRRGEGSVSYTVATFDALATGVQVANDAEIVFDTNAPLVTNTTLHTIDETAPTSAPSSLPSTLTTPTFTVTWAGDDGAGSGVVAYDVYVSVDGGTFQLLLDDTAATSTEFTGEVGKTYAFSTVASDAIGFLEAKTPSAEASTTVVVPTAGGQISGYSYIDVDNDGQLDPTETRLLGVAVQLFRDGVLVATAFSDADGLWCFDNLPAGTYTVQKVQPAIYLAGQETVGSLGAEGVDDNQFRVAMQGDSTGSGYLFAERGLLPQHIGRSRYLASTPENVWQGVDLSVSDQWLTLSPEAPLVTAWLGYNPDGGEARLEMYDAQMQRLAPAAAAVDGALWTAPAGQTHYLRLTGANPAVQLALEFDRRQGDYDLDGAVGRGDHAAWAEAFGATVTPFTGADGNGDGRIDSADYSVWRDAVAQSAPLTARGPNPFTAGQPAASEPDTDDTPVLAIQSFPAGDTQGSATPEADTLAPPVVDRALALLLLDESGHEQHDSASEDPSSSLTDDGGDAPSDALSADGADALDWSPEPEAF